MTVLVRIPRDPERTLVVGAWVKVVVAITPLIFVVRRLVLVA